MDFFTLLELSTDFDEKELKAAYRSKIRKHHPEDDPEGFKRVREAYEAGLKYLEEKEQDEEPFDFFAPIETQTYCNQCNEETSTSPPHAPLLDQLKNLLSDHELRFKEKSWDNWVNEVQQLPIVHFSALNQPVLDLITQRNWLPPSLVNKLWQCFDWHSLIELSEDSQELGYRLKNWCEQDEYFTLSELDQMSHAQQRNCLSFNCSLAKALSDSNIEQVSQWLNHAATFAFLNFKASIALAQALLATNHHNKLLEALFDHICHHFFQSLSVEQRVTVIQIAFRLGKDELIEPLSKPLYDTHNYAEYCQVQYQVNKSKCTDKALIYAFLSDQFWPMPKAYWLAELAEIPGGHTDPITHHWLRDEIEGLESTSVSTVLNLQLKGDQYDSIYEKLWLGLHGSYRSLNDSILETPSLNDPELALLHTIVNEWLRVKIAESQLSQPIFEKLQAYGQPGWFEDASLTEEEAVSMTAPEWINCLLRHPFIPDQWFKLLVEKEILTAEIINDTDTVDTKLYRLLFGRFVNPEFELTSPWNKIRSEHSMVWAEFFYAYLSPNDPKLESALEQLPSLEEIDKDSAFIALLDFVKEQSYAYDKARNLANYPDQFTFHYVTVNQVEWLIQNVVEEELIANARAGDYFACLALCRVWQTTHIDAAIVIWNVLAAHYSYKADNLRTLVNWQRGYLAQEVQNKGLYQDEFKFKEAAALRAYLTTNKDWFTPSNQLVNVKPEDDAKAFHFPMCILLSQLHLGINQQGDDITELRALFKRREEQSGEQQVATDIAISALEEMYQDKLDYDLANGVAKITSSKWRAFSTYILGNLALVPIIGFLDTSNPFLIFGWLIAVFVLTARTISKGLPASYNKSNVYTFPLAYLFFGTITGLTFLSMCFFLSLLYYLSRMSKLYVNNGWARKIIKGKKVDLDRILG
ncbi:DnaJ domain-containing protein [Vibrio sonorensis]|uniref:DnaJ domain-containing protein n=1 Tax=Vibrio sonorensis TaxID=1004316 RepID=UPI0008D90B6E|nr:DnaJ domain-containing protein [Vibrio sonorensis]